MTKPAEANDVEMPIIHRRKGISVIETIMAMGISAIVIAGAVFYINNANETNRVNEAMSQLATLQDVVRTMYQGQGSYNGLSTTLVAQSPMLPNKYRNCSTSPCTPTAGTGVTSSFGRAITFSPTNETGGTGTTHFTITFEGVPRAGCNRLATADFGTGMVRIAVTPTASGSSSSSTTAAQGRPLNPTEANTACANGATIAWTFS